ncbi:hypothetical protein [Oceanobacillus jeddahense]|uniref:hypothetical protein n=1 Tax=Oceanobacillus jeddahense TaxID=1462527 RepID=UPI0005963020|nr:hypothetical protein [Oceanobacillus jeddahense]
MIILGMAVTNTAFSKIVVVLFLSSLALFIVRLTFENESLLHAFMDSFGLFSVIAFIVVVINYFRNRSDHNENQ